jgi:hypothetical protein
VHLAHAREPGSGDAEDGDETPEEDRLGAVPFEEALRPGKNARGVALQPTPPLEQLPPPEPSRPVADVVPDDRSHRGDGDDGDDVHVSARREDARRHERRLARKRNPGRFHPHEQEQDDEPIVADEGLHPAPV